MNDAGMTHAQVMISYDPVLGYFHVHAKGVGPVPQDVLMLMQVIQSSFTKDRHHLVRRDACTTTKHDLDESEDVHLGGTRFSFKNEPGERHDAKQYPDGSVTLLDLAGGKDGV